jgi:hypothetical protein
VPESKSGVISGLLGPGLALANARVSTQAERAMIESNLLVMAELNVQIRMKTIRFNSDFDNLAQLSTTPVPSPPLSWVLSPTQVSRLDSAWQLTVKRIIDDAVRREKLAGVVQSTPTPKKGSAIFSEVPASEGLAQVEDPLKGGIAFEALRRSEIDWSSAFTLDPNSSLMATRAQEAASTSAE